MKKRGSDRPAHTLAVGGGQKKERGKSAALFFTPFSRDQSVEMMASASSRVSAVPRNFPSLPIKIARILGQI